MDSLKGKYKNPKKTAWLYLSKYIRLKYADNEGNVACVCCGDVKKWNEGMDCGHFIPKTRGDLVYFYERNLAPCCVSCNRFKDGNIQGYSLWLSKHYGVEIFEELNNLQYRPSVHYKEIDYIYFIQKYKKLIQELQNTNFLSNVLKQNTLKELK